MLPMIFLGIYKGADLSQHAQFSVTFYNNFVSGGIYPGWAAEDNLGYGSIGVRVYPPLTAFLFAFARLLVGDWHSATWLVLFLFTAIGAIGAYLWAKEFLSAPDSIWAGIIFIFTPYHIYQIYNASQYAEFAGCSVITFSFLFVTRICKRGNLLDILGLAVAFSVLVLTHLPSTVIGAICLLLYSLMMIDKTRLIATLSKLSLAVFLALCASSVYWIKVITEMSLLRMLRFHNNNDFDYFANFLLTAPWFDKRQLWFINFIFIVLIAFTLSAVFILFAKKGLKDKKILVSISAVLSFALFMCTVLSKPIWMIVPYLADTQFPWRWLTIVSVTISVLLATAIEPIRELIKAKKIIKNGTKFFAFSLFACLLIIFMLFWTEFQLNHIPKNNYEAWVWEKSTEMGCDYLWTAAAKESAFTITQKVLVAERQTNISTWQPTERVFSVEAGNATEARIATLYYPHWQATVNNQPVKLKAADDGAISIALPPERAIIRIWFEEPLQIKTTLYISISMWILFGLTFLFANARYRAKTIALKTL